MKKPWSLLMIGLVALQVFCVAGCNTAPQPPAMTFLPAPRNGPLILIVGNTVREFPWSIVDTILDDRTNWTVHPDGDQKAVDAVK